MLLKSTESVEILVWGCEDMSEETDTSPMNLPLYNGRQLDMWFEQCLISWRKINGLCSWMVGVDSFVWGESGKAPCGWVRVSKEMQKTWREKTMSKSPETRQQEQCHELMGLERQSILLTFLWTCWKENIYPEIKQNVRDLPLICLKMCLRELNGKILNLLLSG